MDACAQRILLSVTRDKEPHVNTIQQTIFFLLWLISRRRKWKRVGGFMNINLEED